MTLLTSNFRNEVLSYKLKGFALESDLRNLDKVNASGATEAVVFYCARILEAIIKQAHFQFFGLDLGKPSKKSLKPVEMEQQLYEYNLLKQSRYYWAKGLRLLGNEVRHDMRRIKQSEAEASLIFLDFILNWFFCEFPLGLNQTTIHKGQVFVPQSSNLLLELAWKLNSNSDKLNPEQLKTVFGHKEQEYLKAFAGNFSFPLLLIEIFIEQGDHVSARRLIDSIAPERLRQTGALKGRYMQLNGLLYSREGRLEEALSVLETDYLQQKNNNPLWIDDELIGILAGVYKRIWERDHKNEYLEKCYSIYNWGWKRWNSNVYLGINAAATAFWIDKPSEALEIARQIKSKLEHRRKTIKQKTAGKFDLNYWDTATLAEARLLSNDLQGAYELYTYAFAAFSTLKDCIASTRNQLATLIGRINMESSMRIKFDTLLNHS